jgi:hypothetical protein
LLAPLTCASDLGSISHSAAESYGLFVPFFY